MHFGLAASTVVTSKKESDKLHWKFSLFVLCLQCSSSLHTCRHLAPAALPYLGQMAPCFASFTLAGLHMVASQWVARENDMAATRRAQVGQTAVAVPRLQQCVFYCGKEQQLLHIIYISS